MLRHFGNLTKIFLWIFEEILHDEAERVKQLNGVKTRNKVGLYTLNKFFMT